MQLLIFLWATLLWTACSPKDDNDEQSENGKKPIDSPYQPGKNTPGTTAAAPDTVVWVASSFANWNYSADVNYPGHYDTTKSLFRICGEEILRNASRDLVTLLDNDDCDKPRPGIMIYQKRLDSSQYTGVYPDSVDTSTVQPHLKAKLGNRVIVYELKKEEVQHIKHASRKVRNFNPANLQREESLRHLEGERQ